MTVATHQNDKRSLIDCLEDAINILSPEQIFNWSGHNFQASGDRLRGSCPFHQSASGSSCVVTKSKKFIWCEGCQEGGDAPGYRASLRAGKWIKARGKDFADALIELTSEAGVSIPERKHTEEDVEKAQKWERRKAVLAATQQYCQHVLWSDRGVDARRYLIEERGLSEEKIKELPIGLYPSQSEVRKHLESFKFSKDDWKGTGCVWKDMEGYITFLWNDDHGRPLTIYGRYAEKHPPDGKPKTIALPGERTKKSPLYLDRALEAGNKELVLVEGVLDAVLLQANGDTRVCAYVAASCSGDQIETLKKRGVEKVILCGDPDHGGDKGTASNLERLTKAGISVYVAPTLPDGLDPDEFLNREGIDGWNQHIAAAEHGFRWKARNIIANGDTSTDAGKAEIIQKSWDFTKDKPAELCAFFWPEITKAIGMEMDVESFRTQLENQFSSDDNDVGDHTVEDLVLRKVFQNGEGNWKVMADTFYYYTGAGYWKVVENQLVERKITGKLRIAYKSYKSGDEEIRKYPFSTDSKKASTFKFCRSHLTLENLPFNDHLTAFSNGTVDMRTGELLPHERDHYLTTAIAANYEPNADCPDVFLNFLKNAFGEEQIPLIRAITSMYLDPTAPYGKFAHVRGESGSGKGTLLRLWSSMFSHDHSRSISGFSRLETSEGRHQFLTGAKFVCVPDIKGYVPGLCSFYELIDNGSMSGRALFSSSTYNKKWHVRFAVASVKTLQIENSGEGWDRRVIPLKTQERTVGENPNLGNELNAVKGQIISWALAMPRADRDYLLLNASQNEKVAELKIEQAIQSDSVKAFIDMFLRPTSNPDLIVENYQLYDWYEAFCDAQGLKSLSSPKFIQHMESTLPNNRVKRKHTSRNGKTVSISAHWKNLETLPDNSGPNKDGGANGMISTYKYVKNGFNVARCQEGGLMAFAEFWRKKTAGQNTPPCGCPAVPEPLTQQAFPESPQGPQGTQGKSLDSKNFETRQLTFLSNDNSGSGKNMSEESNPVYPAVPAVNSENHTQQASQRPQGTEKLPCGGVVDPVVPTVADVVTPEDDVQTGDVVTEVPPAPGMRVKLLSKAIDGHPQSDVGGCGSSVTDDSQHAVDSSDSTSSTPDITLKKNEVHACVHSCRTWEAFLNLLDKFSPMLNTCRGGAVSLISHHLSEQDRGYLTDLLVEHLRKGDDKPSYTWIPESLKWLKDDALAKAT